MSRLEVDQDKLLRLLAESLGFRLIKSTRIHSYELAHCSLCGKGYVGHINYRYSFRSGLNTKYLGVPALFVGRICTECESQFKRATIKRVSGKAERQIYPELKIRHQRADGLVCEGPVNSSFYK